MGSIKIRSKRLDGKTQIRTLIAHPMENGRNIDKNTHQPIPTHFIQELTVKHNGKIIVSCTMGASISKDPYFAFMLKGGEPGDKITISWVDNLGGKDAEQHIIK